MNNVLKMAVAVFACVGLGLSAYIGWPLLQTKLSPAVNHADSAVFVTFDPIKLHNAAVGKAAVAASAAPTNVFDITSFGKSAQAALDRVTAKHGDNVIVLVRQAVVRGSLPDVTDEVLVELGVDPNKVPTIANYLSAPITTIPEEAVAEIKQGTLAEWAKRMKQDKEATTIP